MARRSAGRASRRRAIGFQEHLKFFDEDRDREISIGEVRRGLERLGFGHLLTVPAAATINAGVAGLGILQRLPVHPARLPLPRTGFVRHPDSDLVDDDGNFDDARLDAVFARYGRTFDGEAVTVAELLPMLALRVLQDAGSDLAKAAVLPVGIAAAAVEWAALFWVAASRRDGVLVLDKETVRRFYTDKRFFNRVARRIAKERSERAGSALGRMRNVLQDWLL